MDLVHEAGPAEAVTRCRTGGNRPSLKESAGRRLRRPAVLLATALVAGMSVTAITASAASATPVNFGPNVIIFTPTMSQSSIQTELNNISQQQVYNEFGTQRYAVFFEPGVYGSYTDPLIFQIGYYEEIAGLGDMPQDVVINGAITSLNTCNLDSNGNPIGGTCTGDNNFWRSVSNLEINVTTDAGTPLCYGNPYCPASFTSPPDGDQDTPWCLPSGDIFAVSQAAPIRRTIINGNLVLMDYCDEGYVSGGFIADSEINGAVDFYGQQQYLIRNSDIGSSSNSLWNMVFSGVNGAPTTNFGIPCLPNNIGVGDCEPNGSGQYPTYEDQYTNVPNSPVTEEEPFLYTSIPGQYQVFVPAVQWSSSGPSWANGSEAGESFPISDFFIANPSDTVQQINAALAGGQSLILTPGVYQYSSPIVVTHTDTAVMGLGFATLVPQSGLPALIVEPTSGVKVSGLIIDGGPVESQVLFALGTPKSPQLNWVNNPDLVSDVFFRIGGAEEGSAYTSFADFANDSIIDDMWAWRADHGNPGTVGWTVNQGNTGVLVDANNVTAYGLAVEHYQQNEVVWDGNGGTVIFFQNELPYDVPSQSAWMETPTQDGYPAFLVPNNVTSFTGYGMGSYSVFINTPNAVPIWDQESFEAPDTPDVQFNDIFTLWIAGVGGINTVIDGQGGAATAAAPQVEQDVVSFP